MTKTGDIRRIKELEDALKSIVETYKIEYAREIAADALNISLENLHQEELDLDELNFEDPADLRDDDDKTVIIEDFD